MATILSRKSQGTGGGGGGAPSGPAGGDLTGTYPNPDIAANAVGTPEIANGAVTAAKVAADVATQAELDAVSTVATNAVPKALFDANTVLAADTNDTPAALTMGASTILARLAAGNIKAATPAELRTLLDVPTNGEAILDTIVDAKGDLIVGTAADTVARMAVGTNFADVLVPDSAAAGGLRWSRRRNALRPSGSLYETVDRVGGIGLQSGAFLVSQRVGLVGIDLPSGLLITSVSFMSGGTGMNAGVHQIFGIYDSSRVLLRATGDDTNVAWASTAVKTLNLTSTFTTTYSGLHYLAILVEATTVPSLEAVIPAAVTVAIPPIQAGSSTTTVTALPDPAAAITALAVVPWAWVS